MPLSGQLSLNSVKTLKILRFEERRLYVGTYRAGLLKYEYEFEN